MNAPAVVFSADTIEECKAWVSEELIGKMPVDDEYPCSEDVMRSSKTFYYEIYEGEPIVETEDGEVEFKDACYRSNYYYTPDFL